MEVSIAPDSIRRKGLEDRALLGPSGEPRLVFLRARVAIFLDGCFWHGCYRCRSIPATNRAFWVAKIQGNRKRDKKVARMLVAVGWKVMRIWEHELKTDGDGVLRKVRAAAARRKADAMASQHRKR
jgi:DNA mismatch endonuclease, patch repair protein